MNVGYKHTPYNYKSSTASGRIVSKGPLFPQKHRPAKFSGYVLGVCVCVCAYKHVCMDIKYMCVCLYHHMVYVCACVCVLPLDEFFICTVLGVQSHYTSHIVR